MAAMVVAMLPVSIMVARTSSDLDLGAVWEVERLPRLDFPLAGR